MKEESRDRRSDTSTMEELRTWKENNERKQGIKEEI